MIFTNKKSKNEISQRKMEVYERYTKVINWGRAYPIPFCSRFFGIEMLDFQKYLIYNTWFSAFALWLVCRNGSKTTELGIYSMLKSVLFPFHATYFLGNSGEQSKETFKKIEKIAKKEIESFTGCTDVFFEELIRGNSQSDGFTHNPASFGCKLFNGATINTLNSDIVNIKGRRANLVCFDEAGWFSDELFVQAENFVNQDENFKMGKDLDLPLEPKNFPKQLLYASSASDTTSEFYKKFKNFTMEMMMGNTKYFACNFTVDLVKNAKFNGEDYPSLINQDKIDKAMADNREKAERELYNKFSADSHEGQILSRRDIRNVTHNRPPLLENDTGNRKFVFAWDSARLNDNSVIGIAELVKDKDRGYIMHMANVVSLVDIKNKKKTPMRMPEQVKAFKELLLKYNGNDKQKLDYENIDSIVCDSGAGGNMIGGIADYLLENWKDKHGIEHKGLIDSSHKANETAKYQFKDAVDIMKLVDPQKNRNTIIGSISRMVKLGVIDFPTDYDGKDSLFFIDDEGNEINQVLTSEEQITLTQMELMKTEIVTMCKYENAGNVKYDFPPDKRNKMHDDRAFVFGLLCYRLEQLRHISVVESPKKHRNLRNMNYCVSNFSL